MEALSTSPRQKRKPSAARPRLPLFAIHLAATARSRYCEVGCNPGNQAALPRFDSGEGSIHVKFVVKNLPYTQSYVQIECRNFDPSQNLELLTIGEGRRRFDLRRPPFTASASAASQLRWLAGWAFSLFPDRTAAPVPSLPVVRLVHAHRQARAPSHHYRSRHTRRALGAIV